MSMFRLSSRSVAYAAMFLVVGCGGAGVQTDGGRGEGNIPIGKLSYLQGPIAISECAVGQNSPLTIDSQGTIWANQFPIGQTTITIATPTSTDVLPVVLGVQQSGVIAAYYNVPSKNTVVTGLTISLTNGQAPVVGNTYAVSIAVAGSNLAGLRPNMWINNGLGYFDANNNFVATTAGSGSICAELCGVSATLPITVH